MPLRLLLIGASADLYGSDKVLLDVVQALAEHCEISVALPAHGPLLTKLQRHRVSVLVMDDFAMRKRDLSPTGALRWIVRVRRSFRELAALHRRRGFDVVYSNTLAVPLGALLRWRLHIPHVWHVHEVLQEPRWFARALSWVVRMESDRVVCVSGSVRIQLESLQPKIAAKSSVVYNAVALPSQGALVRTARRTDNLVIGSIGRIYPRKGHRLLLEALALARQRGFECFLRIFGSALPGAESHVSSLIEVANELKLGDATEFCGFVDDPERIYAGIDVLVLPSIEPEALPLACLEAQAWGLPVIAPNEGGPTEIVVDNETGILVPPRDLEALADAIELMAREPGIRRRLGSAGRQRVADLFDQGHFRQTISVLVESALDQT